MLSFSACADGGNSGAGDAPSTGTTKEATREERVAVRNLRQSFIHADALMTDSRAEARCMATGLVDDFGIKRLQGLGLLSSHLTAMAPDDEEEMSRRDAGTYVDVILRWCPTQSSWRKWFHQTSRVQIPTHATARTL